MSLILPSLSTRGRQQRVMDFERIRENYRLDTSGIEMTRNERVMEIAKAALLALAKLGASFALVFASSSVLMLASGNNCFKENENDDSEICKIDLSNALSLSLSLIGSGAYTAWSTFQSEVRKIKKREKRYHENETDRELQEIRVQQEQIGLGQVDKKISLSEQRVRSLQEEVNLLKDQENQLKIKELSQLANDFRNLGRNAYLAEYNKILEHFQINLLINCEKLEEFNIEQGIQAPNRESADPDFLDKELIMYYHTFFDRMKNPIVSKKYSVFSWDCKKIEYLRTKFIENYKVADSQKDLLLLRPLELLQDNSAAIAQYFQDLMQGSDGQKHWFFNGDWADQLASHANHFGNIANLRFWDLDESTSFDPHRRENQTVQETANDVMNMMA